MNYKKQRIQIGDPANRQLYAYEHDRCECCGSNLNLAVHHRLKQQYQYKGERYTIDLSINYNILCNDKCHPVIDTLNERQYNREIFPKNGIEFNTWIGLKGIDVDDFFEALAKDENVL